MNPKLKCFKHKMKESKGLIKYAQDSFNKWKVNLLMHKVNW